MERFAKNSYLAHIRKVLIFFYISGNGNSSSSIKKAFLIFQETESPKKFFIFQETEVSYISGNRNFKKRLIFLKVTFRVRKMKKSTLKKKNLLLFQEMKKISLTLGLLLILFAERELFKHKREIIFLSLPAAIFACRSRSKFRLYECFPSILIGCKKILEPITTFFKKNRNRRSEIFRAFISFLGVRSTR